MAEIKIEQKSTPIWPWLLLALLIIGGLAWYFLADDDEVEIAETEQIIEEPVNEEAVVMVGPAEMAAVSNFVAFVDESRNMPDMNLNHDYSHKAITLYANALQEMSMSRGESVKNMANDMKMKADKLQDEAEATYHADLIKQAAMTGNSIMAEIQKESYPDMAGAVDKLKASAEQIDLATLTLDQKKMVKAYFEQAADVMKKMKNA